MTDLGFLPLALLGGLGPWEVIIILVVALQIFGHRLPDVARSAGKAVNEFKRGLKDVESDVNKVAKEEDSKPAQIETKDEAKKA